MSNSIESSFEAILSQSPEQLAAYREKLQKQLSVIDALLQLTPASAATVATRRKLPAAQPESDGRRKRAASVPITIEQVVKQIKGGKTNAPRIAEALGCAASKVRSVIDKEGKAAGIGHSGKKAAFAYHIK